MTEHERYQEYEMKLKDVCEENGLTYIFEKGKYPISLIIKPIKINQINMFEEDEAKTFSEGYIQFKYIDGDIHIITSETFIVGDDAFIKIRNLFKKMYFFWVQHFFRTAIEPVKV